MRTRCNGWTSALALGMLGATGIAAAGCQIQRYPIMPVTLRNRQALIGVKINGKPAVIAVDTGASYSILSPQAVHRFNLTRLFAPPGLFLAGVGGDTQPQLVNAHTFTFVRQELHQVQFLVAGGGSPVHSVGLLGDNLMHVADIEFNLPKGYMRFVRPAHCGNMPLAYWAGHRPVGVVPLHPPTSQTPQFIGSAMLDGRRITVMFDTGSGRSLLSLSTAEQLHIGPGDPGVKPDGRVSGIAHRFVKAWIAPIARLQIGGETIEHTHLMVASMSRLNSADLVLGLDFFLAHHLYIANSQNKVYFTYSGGPVFALGQAHQHAGSTSANPAESAPALIRRGLAERTREQYRLALSDFDRACALEPTDAQCFLYRGQTRLALQQPARALADFNTSLRLRANHAVALLARARARLEMRRSVTAHAARELTAAASADLTAASRVLPPGSVRQMQLGRLADEAGAFRLAIRAFHRWIRAHRPEVGLPYAWAGLCWAHAAANQHLNRALRECNQALERVAGSAAVLESRALGEIRLGQWHRALRDEQAALAEHPHRAMALYGLGLAELHFGHTAAAQADFAAAARADPEAERRYAQMDLTS